MSQGPHTYQQWLDCLQQLEQHPFNRDLQQQVRMGTYDGKPTETFLSRVSASVSVMLSVCTRRFLHEMDQALADGEPDMAVVLASRFRRRIGQCLFYRDLGFFEEDYVRTLDDGFRNQLDAFWKDFLNQLQKSLKDSMDPRVEDMALELRRIKTLVP